MVSYKNRSVVGVRLSALVCLSSIIFSLNLGRRAEDSSREYTAEKQRMINAEKPKIRCVLLRRIMVIIACQPSCVEGKRIRETSRKLWIA